VLRSYLKAAQDDISILLEEKKALLDTIRSLQVTQFMGFFPLKRVSHRFTVSNFVDRNVHPNFSCCCCCA